MMRNNIAMTLPRQALHRCTRDRDGERPHLSLWLIQVMPPHYTNSVAESRVLS